MNKGIKAIIKFPAIVNPVGYYPKSRIEGLLTREEIDEIRKLGVRVDEEESW
jgi:hypothetical protein